MFAIKSIGKMTTSIGRTLLKSNLSSLSVANLMSSNSLSKSLQTSLGGVKGPLGAQSLLSTLSSLDVSGNKALAANPALRDAILALQKQAAAGNVKAVTSAYSKF